MNLIHVLLFAEKHVTWTDDNWSKVHFIDEIKLVKLVKLVLVTNMYDVEQGRDFLKSLSRGLINSEEGSVIV